MHKPECSSLHTTRSTHASDEHTTTLGYAPARLAHHRQALVSILCPLFLECNSGTQTRTTNNPRIRSQCHIRENLCMTVINSAPTAFTYRSTMLSAAVLSAIRVVDMTDGLCSKGHYVAVSHYILYPLPKSVTHSWNAIPHILDAVPFFAPRTSVGSPAERTWSENIKRSACGFTKRRLTLNWHTG